MENFEKPNRIEELEKKLYSQNQQVTQKDRKPLRSKEYDVAHDWQSDSADTITDSALVVEEKKPNWFFRFFIVALIFFIGAGAYLGITWYLNSGVDASSVDILVNAPLTIGAGEVLNFEVTAQNQNQIPITYVEMDVQYPDGTRSSSDIGQDLRTTTEKVDSLAIGEIMKRNYQSLLFGEESEKKEITIFLTYQAEGSTKLFKKEKKFDVVLSSTPIRLTITNVKETTAGQDVDFTVELVSNSSQTLKNVIVQAVYPFGFSYKSSTLSPQEDKKTWIIESLKPKEALTFSVKGKIEGQNKDDRYFKFLVGLQKPNTNEPQVVFSSKDTTIAITRPFLELDLSIDQDNNDIIVVDPAKTQSSMITFKNNSEFPLRNAMITLKISGSSIVKSSVSVAEGFYQSLTDTISWDYTTAEDLVSIPIGTTGHVSFSFNSLTSSLQQIITNPEVLFTINVKANRNPQNQVADTIENSIIKKIRFNTQVTLDTQSNHYTSVFQNSGPVPPKAEQRTTYTGTITLKNTTNAISNGTVTMKIPNYVQYEGAFAPASESVSFDSTSRILTWNLGSVAAKTGYLGIAPRQIHIQFGIIPSISQVGMAPVLAEHIIFNGTDTFTKSEITQEGEDISTAIEDSLEYRDGDVSR
ncbi:MAG: hypothetical protein RLZZ517_188 [Candidatus Parcubacteria bacterium]|jgi:hypothetical protein